MELVKGEDFESKLSATPLVIVEFGAPGCAPCKNVPPVVKSVLKRFSKDRISAFRIDITRDFLIAQKYSVLGLPTVIVFKNADEIQRFNSVPKKEKLLSVLEKAR